MPGKSRDPATYTWIDLALLATLGLVLMCWTWGTWPDVQIDFGRELYIPWRLVAGDVLYRDLAYFNGPLSPYLNACWFHIFGVSLSTLVWCNAAVLLGMVLLCYQLLHRIADRLAAVAGGVVFLTVFAFGQLVGIGNYNYLCPYSHEMTHGVALSLAALLFLSNYLRGGRRGWLVATGMALGGIWLTKAEIFVAAAAAVGVTLTAKQFAAQQPHHSLFRELCLVLGTAIVLVIAVWAALGLAMPPATALRGILGTWNWVGRPEVTAIPFYRRSAGLSHPGQSLRLLLGAAAVYFLAGLPAALLAMRLRTSKRHGWITALGAFAITAVGLGAIPPALIARDGIRPLPVVLLGVIGWIAVKLRRTPRGAQPRRLLQLAASVFALGLLSKIALNTRVHHYGFVLAMPGTLLLAATLTSWLPRALSARCGDGGVVRAAGLAVLLVGILVHLRVEQFWRQHKTMAVGQGADRFLADGRGLVVNRVLGELSRRQRGGTTLAVLPEGVLINYLARCPNPTPYTNMIQWDMVLYGEDRVTAAFQLHPPQYVVLMDRDVTEHGLRADGRRLFDWINRAYREVAWAETVWNGRPFRARLLQYFAGRAADEALEVEG